MDNYYRLIKYSDKLLINNNISINEKEHDSINKLIAIYIDTLIFNIISIACIINILNNNEKILPKSIPIIHSYINERCKFKSTNKKITGGVFNTATFFGVQEPQYKSDNEGVNLLNIDFKNGVLRPQIGGVDIDKTDKVLLLYINNILKYHEMSASKDIKKELLNIIKTHINYLIIIIKKLDSQITIKKLNTIINKYKFLCPLK